MCSSEVELKSLIEKSTKSPGTRASTSLMLLAFMVSISLAVITVMFSATWVNGFSLRVAV